eukprot:gnl/TRDRNA2_/TRDRNA2_166599_c0_seq1.p3 gnl/TRDRNA2_/TRDRNA2_166599_c0~~gnl/TRDRNA2_/TRDRNA2_166599_c0_seq1.p3  ORF type:complete len:112 (-),score=20.43 gnl/TRDRNA2_/TRDRNA2_166599_c0_seq1:270-605(-)
MMQKGVGALLHVAIVVIFVWAVGCFASRPTSEHMTIDIAAKEQQHAESRVASKNENDIVLQDVADDKAEESKSTDEEEGASNITSQRRISGRPQFPRARCREFGAEKRISE